MKKYQHFFYNTGQEIRSWALVAWAYVSGVFKAKKEIQLHLGYSHQNFKKAYAAFINKSFGKLPRATDRTHTSGVRRKLKQNVKKEKTINR